MLHVNPVPHVEARKRFMHVAREPGAACGGKKENMHGEVVIRENLEYHEMADVAPMVPIGGEGVHLVVVVEMLSGQRKRMICLDRSKSAWACNPPQSLMQLHRK